MQNKYLFGPTATDANFTLGQNVDTLIRRSAQIFIVATLVFVASPSASAATNSALGAACTRTGQLKLAGGIRYTCKKVRGKFSWVVVKSPKGASSLPGATVSTPVSKVGTACKTQGEELVSTESVVCRQVSGNTFKYFPINDPVTSVVNPGSPSNLATCRLPDLRPQPVQPPGTSITFPLTPKQGSVKAGVQTIAVVGFDFADAPGVGNPLEVFGSQLDTAKSFFDWYSNGKVTLDFRLYDKWIRLDGSANRFKTGEHFEAEGELSMEQMANEYLRAARSHVDLTGITALWFVYPKDIKQLRWNFGMSGGSYGLPAIYGAGPNRYSPSLPLWSYFVHELLHEQGLQGHSPKAPWIFGIMLNDGGLTQSLNSWDELALDWLQDSEVYCVEKEKLSTVELELSPVERKQSGLRSVMVKLGNHQSLVIESHRTGPFSLGMPSGIYGLTVQLVDTTRETTWSDDRATSTFVQVGKGHQKYPAFGKAVFDGWSENSGIAVSNGFGVSQAAYGIDMSYFLLEGETTTVSGVKIEFQKSRYTDRIAISLSN